MLILDFLFPVYLLKQTRPEKDHSVIEHNLISI